MELLERDGVLADLGRLLRQADGGSGCLLFIGGEAGVGKTALLRRFIAEQGSDAVVLLGQCDALSTPRALSPLFDIAAAEPALQRLFNDNAPRDRLFHAVLTRLGSGARPVVMVIEDAHWADEATLDLVRYLGRRVERTRSLVLITYRNDEVGPRHPFRQVLGDLAAATAIHRLSVPPLTPAGVATLASGSGIDPDALFARTGGNPFFVTAVIAAGGAYPETVRDAVLARAARLPAAAWEILEAAAVIGPAVEPDLLDRVVDGRVENLGACMESGILEDHGAAFAFRHELAREAVLSVISPARRKTLHAQVLQRLEATLSGPLHPARLAHHAEEAGDRGAVLRHAPEAARRAAHFQSHREAAAQYRRALRFADDLPSEERAALLEAMALESYWTAHIEQAVAARTAALAIWTRAGNTRREAINRCHLANLLWAQARIGDAEREAETAVSLLEAYGEGPELATAYGTLARLRGTTLRDNEALRLGEKAIAMAERFGPADARIDALMTVGEARLARGDVVAGQRQIELSMLLSADAGFDVLTARGYISLGYGFAECGRICTATRRLEEGIRFCSERDLDLPRHHLTALLARCRLSLGDWDEAHRLARSVLEIRDSPPGSRFVALLVEGSLLARRGDPGVEPLLAEASALATASECVYYLGPAHAARAEARFLSGEAPAAAHEARAAYALAVERGHSSIAAELAYWRWKGGDPVTPPAASAEPYALQIAGDWRAAAAAWEARGCRYEAACARLEGRHEPALRAALATFEELGCRPAAALARGRLRDIGARRVPRGPRPATRANPAGLTRRETEVLALLAEGRSNQEIASRLFLSPRTVENHVSAILAKLGAETRADAVDAAARLGIVPQSG